MKFRDPSECIYLVLDTDFNHYWYSDLVGKTFENPPAYAQVKVLPKDEVNAN